MHCDDKRTLSVLKENIINYFNELKEKDFDNKIISKKLNDAIAEYNECKLYI
jgi:benzoyl-CoA reductase/2-hydroxyglutaryl-CoA dehydratase subunit BcrC/BadD/HgdB